MKGQIFAPKHCAIASPSLATPTWKIEYGPNKIHRGIVTIWSYWAIMYYLKISGQPQDDVVKYQYLTSPSILPMFPSELHFWCSSRTTAKNSVWRPCHAALQTPASSQPKCELEPQFDKRRKVTQGPNLSVFSWKRLDKVLDVLANMFQLQVKWGGWVIKIKPRNTISNIFDGLPENGASFLRLTWHVVGDQYF